MKLQAVKRQEEKILFVYQSIMTLLTKDHTPGTTNAMKKLGGRSAPHGYTFPPLAWIVERLREDMDIVVDESVYTYLNRNIQPLQESDYPQLQPWQLEAVNYMVTSPHKGGIVALSPGLGKTLTALTARDSLKAKRTLIICPRPLMLHWKMEAEKWYDLDAVICWRKAPHETAEIVIANYETVVTKFKDYEQQWDMIIIDESLMIKNRKAKRMLVALELRAYARHCWLLSGSPTSRFADDLYAQLKVVLPQGFTSYWRFAETYCEIKETVWGNSIVGTKRGVDIRRDFRDLMFVKHRSEVINLPETLYETINLELLPEQKTVYKQMRDEFIALLENSSEPVIAPVRIAQMTRLQQITSNVINIGGEDKSIKADAIEQMLSTSAYEPPILIWTHWRVGAEALYKRLVNNKEIDLTIDIVLGNDKDLAEKVQSYIDGKTRVLIFSIQSGKYGFNLQNTKTMIYMDRTWDMDAYIQSLDRVHRMTLQHSPTIVTLHCPGTIDDMIAQNLAGKAVDIANITNGNLAQLMKGLES